MCCSAQSLDQSAYNVDINCLVSLRIFVAIPRQRRRHTLKIVVV